ncbi:peroxisomal membrane protein 11C [Anoplophora glabripennis]|uniref:peroxisomal membrane protein 11C n=1 Tax=Anoplophora glabripennis TaxID=217634 RepID=UPI000873FA5F|nr:peroxisomal membrane protein 11C [Anoplophora glabripennis]
MSLLKTILNEICLLLETYKGRDKILRTLCYTTKLIGGLHKNEEVAKKFLFFSSHMSSTRATLRLLDDLPMLKYNLEYGLGHEEPDKYLAQLGVVTNLIDQIYYPIEKMSFIAEHKLVSGIDNNKWDTASSVCWVLSIYLTLMKTMRYISVLQKHKKCVQADKSVPIEQIVLMQKYEVLTSVRLLMDLVHAVNTLPPGFLWSSKLQTWHVGLIASLSSILGIYQIYYKRSIK